MSVQIRFIQDYEPYRSGRVAVIDKDGAAKLCGMGVAMYVHDRDKPEVEADKPKPSGNGPGARIRPKRAKRR